MKELKYPHLFLASKPQSPEFTSPKTGRNQVNFPDRPDRKGHAQLVRQALDGAWKSSEERNEQRKAVSLPTRTGTYIEFQSAPGFELSIKSLDLRQSGIRLLNVAKQMNTEGQQITLATVYVPSGKEAILLKKVDQYETEDTDSGNPKNEPLLAGINALKEAVLESFWRDDLSLVPTEQDWCEAWLRCAESPEAVIDSFTEVCQALEIEVKQGHLSFPERVVLLVKVSHSQLRELIVSFDNIAEFRKAKATAAFFMGEATSEQSEWAGALAARVELTPESTATVCLLDTGVNNGHIMLSPVLASGDCHSVDQSWGYADQHGHGTLMCGVAAYGADIGALLQSTHQIEVPYILESVKLIPSPGTHHDQELYGLRTKQALSRAEIERPNHNRAACLSVTSEDFRDEGRPSSWSGSVDQLCSGAEDGVRRLMIIAAGNIKDSNEWKSYPDSNITQAVHDPGQAWNALTIGAFTEKVEISDKDLAAQYSPIAGQGELSPYSTTSHLWDNKWPNKPDIVFEGGNAGIDNTGFASELDDFSILSTNHAPPISQFSVINATSAASAQAAQMAGNLFARYPDAWPETIRALMVHSARWTEALQTQFFNSGVTDKTNFASIIRSCGYGVPSYKSALESAQNSLTLITEQELQPFQKKENGGYETKEMHLVELPWPTEALSQLPGETEVTINVTLSYFVEPGPGEVGWRDKYRYRSHGLDFDLKGPNEDSEEFLKRLNKAARSENDNESSASSIGWSIGSNTRNRGSIHRDWWVTSAAEAASCNVVGVFPRIGWWRERSHLGKFDSVTRYALIVTLGTPNQTIDIYTPIANLILPEIEIPI